MLPQRSSQNMTFLLVKSGLYVKDESCSLKIELVKAIFVHQVEVKSLFLQILKSCTIFRFCSKLNL